MILRKTLSKTLLPPIIAAALLPSCSSAPAPSAEPPASALMEGAGTPAEQTRGAPGHYRILKDGRQQQDNWLKLNEYFLIHYLHADIFRRFGLNGRFTLEDKIRIFAAILYNLDYQSPVNLIIDNFNDEDSLVVSLQLIRFGGYSGVLLATNTDREGAKIYVGAENAPRTYKRSYLIVEDQLIALPDLYSQRKESELIVENSADRLARFYIFDGNRNNDAVAEGLLIGSIREAADPLERSRSELILSRYYMSRRRLVEAQALLIEVGSQLTRLGGDDELREWYTVVYEELLITNALQQHEARMRESRPKPL